MEVIPQNTAFLTGYDVLYKGTLYKDAASEGACTKVQTPVMSHCDNPEQFLGNHSQHGDTFGLKIASL